MFILILLSFLSTSFAQAKLPTSIDISNFNQAVNIYYEYALSEGKLYQRKDEFTEWELTDGIGLPHKNGKVLPELKGKLTKVFADGNIVLVADEDNQVFRIDTELAVINIEKELYSWRKSWGNGILKLRTDLKSIAYARRTVLNVKYVDDRFGAKIKAGNPSSLASLFHEQGSSGLMHFYGLSQDGKRLYFADNGLTLGFNYEFDLPKFDDFVGESIAASGSMVTVLDTKGRFWVKFLDFDWYGCNPMMFEYSYSNKNVIRNEDHLPGFGLIHIPLPTWRELPKLEVAANDSHSAEIALFTTGFGNAARELRVRGKKDSECGYYFMSLTDLSWDFKKTGICAEKEFVAVKEVSKTLSRLSGLSGSFNLHGKIYSASIEEYSLTDSPVVFNLVDPQSNELVFKGQLHLVPAWSPTNIQDPGRDGRYKLFHATVEADSGFENSAFAKEYNLKTFNLTAYGGQHELLIKPLADDKIIARLSHPKLMKNTVFEYLFKASQTNGIAASCKDLTARIASDEKLMYQMMLGTPVVNFLGVLTGTRFWYHHGISMIPPLGRMMDWGTRLIYDRYHLAHYEMGLLKKRCKIPTSDYSF